MQIEATSATKKKYMELKQQESSGQAKHWKAPKQGLFSYLPNINHIILSEHMRMRRDDYKNIIVNHLLKVYKDKIQIRTNPVQDSSIPFLSLVKDKTTFIKQIQKFDKPKPHEFFCSSARMGLPDLTKLQGPASFNNLLDF